VWYNQGHTRRDSQGGTVTLPIDLLEESFDLVVARGDDLTTEFYRRVFARGPQLQELFRHVPMSLQKIKFIGTLVVLRQSLRQLEAVVPELEALGARHVAYGALPEHYPLVAQALVEAMAAVGGERWTPAYTAAWTEAYALVQEVMLRGAAAAQASDAGARA
jgi:hemoglobin-like flavoprotein